MSNRAHIYEYTKTYSHDPKRVYRGVEVWDDLEQTHIDMDKIPKDDFELLQVVLHDHYDDVSSSILDAVPSEGVNIRGNWYDWEEVEHVFNDEADDET